MVSEPVAKEMLGKVKIDWEALRERARLCPDCRRKRTAETFGLVAAGRKI